MNSEHITDERLAEVLTEAYGSPGWTMADVRAARAVEAASLALRRTARSSPSRLEIVGDSIEGPGGRISVMGRGLTREEVTQVATMHTSEDFAGGQSDVNRMLCLLHVGAIVPCRGIDLQYRSPGSSGWPHPWRATFIQPDTAGAAPTVVFDICPSEVLRRLVRAFGYHVEK